MDVWTEQEIAGRNACKSMVSARPYLVHTLALCPHPWVDAETKQKQLSMDADAAGVDLLVGGMGVIANLAVCDDLKG